MKANSPDGYIREYLKARQRGARGLNFVDSTGRKYLKRCQKCKHRHRHWSSKEKMWVCGHCGKAWKYYSRYLMKGHVQVTRNANVAEIKAVDLGTTGVLLDHWLNDPELPPWHARLYVYMIMVESSARALARGKRPSELVGFPYGWYLRSVTETIREGRKEWTRRLLQAGLVVK